MKQTLLAISLLMTAGIAAAQVSLSDALDSLQKQRLITRYEKSQVLDRQAQMESRGKTNNVELPARDFSRRDEWLKLLTEAKMFSTSGTLNVFTFTPDPVSARSLPQGAIRDALDSFIRTLDSAGLLSAFTRWPGAPSWPPMRSIISSRKSCRNSPTGFMPKRR